MYLLLYPKIQNTTVVLFDENGEKGKKEVPEYREMLQDVERLLQEQNIEPTDIQGIAVVMESGSFTATRLATIIANTWQYVRHIPIIGVLPDDGADLKTLLEKIKNASKERYILPEYSGEPNIG